MSRDEYLRVLDEYHAAKKHFKELLLIVSEAAEFMGRMPKILHLAYDVNNSGHQVSSTDSTMLAKGVAPKNWPNGTTINDALRTLQKTAEQVAEAWGTLNHQDRMSVTPPDFSALAK